MLDVEISHFVSPMSIFNSPAVLIGPDAISFNRASTPGVDQLVSDQAERVRHIFTRRVFER
jgi:hypothetical protein